MTKKFIPFILTLILISTMLLFGCTDKQTSKVSNDNQRNDNKISLKFSRLSYTDVRPPAGELWMWKRYEEKTGIHIDWEEIPRDGYEERKNIMMAANDLPDAFYQAPFSNEEIMKYGSTGLFLTLNDLIDSNAKNIKGIFEDKPSIRKNLTMPDGNIYSLPYIIPESLGPCFKYYINQNWLENLDLEIPETIGQLANVLQQFKDKDANGNGDRDDEVPLYFPNGMFVRFECSLLGSYGLSNKGYYAYNMWVDLGENNKLRFIPTEDRYKETWQLMHEWWKAGYFHPETFSGIDYARWAADGAENKVGLFTWCCPHYLGQKISSNYYGITAFKGPHGDQIFSDVSPELSNSSAFMLTDVNKYPEESMKWVDYFYSEEGSNFGCYGEEGVTYNLDEEGNPKYIDEILNYEGGPQLGAFQWLDNVYGGGYPYLEPPMEKIVAMDKNIEDYLRLDVEDYEKYMPNDVWYTFTSSDEEYPEINALSTDINTYIQEMRVKFITGELDFDKDWDKYVEQLKKIGSDRYLEIRQQQYERYLKN